MTNTDINLKSYWIILTYEIIFVLILGIVVMLFYGLVFEFATNEKYQDIREDDLNVYVIGDTSVPYQKDSLSQYRRQNIQYDNLQNEYQEVGHSNIINQGHFHVNNQNIDTANQNRPSTYNSHVLGPNINDMNFRSSLGQPNLTSNFRERQVQSNLFR